MNTQNQLENLIRNETFAIIIPTNNAIISIDNYFEKWIPNSLSFTNKIHKVIWIQFRSIFEMNHM